MKITLNTQRLEIVPMEMKFLESTHLYAGDHENTKLMMFLPNDTIEETRDFILHSQEEWEKLEPSSYEFAVLMDGIHVGGMSLERLEEDSCAEIGWCIRKDFWCRGIAFEAAERIFRFAIEDLGFSKIIARCDAENLPSFRLMEKLGMRRVSETGGRKNKGSDEERRELVYKL